MKSLADQTLSLGTLHASVAEAAMDQRQCPMEWSRRLGSCTPGGLAPIMRTDHHKRQRTIGPPTFTIRVYPSYLFCGVSSRTSTPVCVTVLGSLGTVLAGCTKPADRQCLGKTLHHARRGSRRATWR
jgi:hypothetical protein